jgi:hypothetical protein
MKNKGCMVHLKQNERLVKEMPSLMQIQYGLNTLRFFPHKKVTTLPENISQRGRYWKRPMFDPLLRTWDASENILALKKTSFKKKLTNRG